MIVIVDYTQNTRQSPHAQYYIFLVALGRQFFKTYTSGKHINTPSSTTFSGYRRKRNDDTTKILKSSISQPLMCSGKVHARCEVNLMTRYLYKNRYKLVFITSHVYTCLRILTK